MYLSDWYVHPLCYDNVFEIGVCTNSVYMYMYTHNNIYVDFLFIQTRLLPCLSFSTSKLVITTSTFLARLVPSIRTLVHSSFRNTLWLTLTTWSIDIVEMVKKSTVAFFMSGWKAGGGSLRHGPHWQGSSTTLKREN